MDFTTDTWTTVANRALAALGRELLTDAETDQGGDAELVRQSIPEAVGVCAEWFDWSFLREKADLTPDSAPYSQGYGHSFALPPDAARIQLIEAGHPYEILGGRICTDSDTCRITYIRRPGAPVPNAHSWNTAVQHYLAFLLAKSLTGNDATVQREYQLFQTWIDKAVANDRSYLRKRGEKWWTEEIYG